MATGDIFEFNINKLIKLRKKYHKFVKLSSNKSFFPNVNTKGVDLAGRYN